MKKRPIFFLFLKWVFLLILMSSCGKDLFSPSRKFDRLDIPDQESFSASSCAQFTIVKPKVDFLFIWDNSTSTYFINDETLKALDNTIDLISSRFDYHAMVAPLIGTGNQDAFIFSYNSEGLSSGALAMKVDRSIASQKVRSLPRRPGSFEPGVTRAIDLLRSNIDNGVFRENVYTIVVIMSNTDDLSGNEGTAVVPAHLNKYIAEKKEELLCLRGGHDENCQGKQLDATQLRFMSIVMHQDHIHCPNVSQGIASTVYRRMSEQIYLAPYSNNNPNPSDQSNRSTPDSYDICSIQDFSRIFDGINNSIQDQLIKHRYNYWPVATESADPIDPDEISIQKNTGKDFPRLTPPVSPGESGFTFENKVKTVNTRYYPTEGEEFSGYVVELFGEARVQYPECLLVRTKSPKEFYGYVHLDSRPRVDTIVLTINGKEVPESESSGWQVVSDSAGSPQYFDSKNIMINSPEDFTPKEPGLMKSGYFLKLSSEYVYGNGSLVEVNYLRQGND